ncbi:MAG: 23S rRNA (guanosine(2251)-2'-O)-methyltransferase RlmB [Halobacteriales archaeon]|nr:23S rRNA (guanosine(2251)-2'-O)-methyltransferase RlmB [Halobacteriales archaeon]
MQWDVVAGIHPVLEALRAGREVHRVLLAKGREDDRVREVLAAARARGVGIERRPKAQLDELYGGQHQGVIALVKPQGYSTLEDALGFARQRGHDPFLLALDHVEDPHNLGAVLRTGEAAGCHGVIIPERGSAALTASVHKASAGASQRVPVVLVTNLANALRELKRQGVWVGGAAQQEGKAPWDTKLTGPLCLVLGSEGEGLGRLTQELCDFTVRIPMTGEIASLNVSAAAAVLCFERVRQRAQAAPKAKPAKPAKPKQA